MRAIVHQLAWGVACSTHKMEQVLRKFGGRYPTRTTECGASVYVRACATRPPLAHSCAVCVGGVVVYTRPPTHRVPTTRVWNGPRLRGIPCRRFYPKSCKIWSFGNSMASSSFSRRLSKHQAILNAAHWRPDWERIKETNGDSDRGSALNEARALQDTRESRSSRGLVIQLHFAVGQHSC